jgi:NADH-ubiquinone oxidoreductase chain 1
LSINFINILFLFILGVTVYRFVLAGWRSYSKFAYLGGVRAGVQTISYEIGLAVLIILIIIIFNNFNFLNIINSYYIILLPIFLNWILILISETNRAPFDFAEGESELISGFNVEYGRSGFVLFFLREYSIIIFFRILTCYIFNLNILSFFLLLFIFIRIRTSFPRYRYDKLQLIIWFKILPFLCSLLIFLLLF